METPRVELGALRMFVPCQVYVTRLGRSTDTAGHSYEHPESRAKRMRFHCATSPPFRQKGASVRVWACDYKDVASKKSIGTTAQTTAGVLGCAGVCWAVLGCAGVCWSNARMLGSAGVTHARCVRMHCLGVGPQRRIGVRYARVLGWAEVCRGVLWLCWGVFGGCARVII